MSFRTRLALLIALGLLAAGSIALIVNAVTYQEGVVRSPEELQTLILKKLHIDPAAADAAVRANPELVYTYNGDKPIAPGQLSVNQAFQAVQRDIQRDAIRRSRFLTAGAVAVLALVTASIGWVIAGRALRPVRLIASRARAASAQNLSARVSLEGPDDEFKTLADTFDAMLARLEASFAAQQRFAAQASHELRTPLAVIRSETDLLLTEVAGDDATREPIESIHTATLRAERIVTTLLALARSESGNTKSENIALDELVGDVVADTLEGTEWTNLRVDLELARAPIVGDGALIESLVRNLVDNAARHNCRNGWVRVEAGVASIGPDAYAVLTVANSLGTPTSEGPEAGIGLTLVHAIVESHGGRIKREATTGRMTVRVYLPTPLSGRSEQLRAPEATETSRA